VILPRSRSQQKIASLISHNQVNRLICDDYAILQVSFSSLKYSCSCWDGFASSDIPQICSTTFFNHIVHQRLWTKVHKIFYTSKTPQCLFTVTVWQGLQHKFFCRIAENVTFSYIIAHVKVLLCLHPALKRLRSNAQLVGPTPPDPKPCQSFRNWLPFQRYKHQTAGTACDFQCFCHPKFF